LDNARLLLTNYPPVYQGGDKFFSNSLPLKKVEYLTDDIETHNLYGDYDPLLKNRVNGLIENNFYGVPYIADGNKLIYV
jgi:hypothetical protein